MTRKGKKEGEKKGEGRKKHVNDRWKKEDVEKSGGAGGGHITIKFVGKKGCWRIELE